jgi:hypothetical protein
MRPARNRSKWNTLLFGKALSDLFGILTEIGGRMNKTDVSGLSPSDSMLLSARAKNQLQLLACRSPQKVTTVRIPITAAVGTF